MDAHTSLLLIPGEHITVGVCAPAHVGALEADPLGAEPGIYVLMGEDQRQVGFAPSLHSSLEQALVDAPWVQCCFFFCAQYELDLAQYAYMEDRLVHMFSLEDFRMEPRVQRNHTGLGKDLKDQASHLMLLALAVAEQSEHIGLFEKSDGNEVDLPTLTLPLVGDNPRPLIP